MNIKLQRKLVNFLYEHKLGAIGRYFIPKEDQEKLDALVAGVKASQEYVAPIQQLAMDKYQDTAIWFTQEKIQQLPGGSLVFNDGVMNLHRVVENDEKFFDFMRKFVQNDDSYQVVITFFATLPEFIGSYGAFDKGTELSEHEQEALDLVVVRTLVGKLSGPLSGQYDTTQLTYGLLQLLTQDEDKKE